MNISSIRIRNFRSLVDVVLPMSAETVIIGENNTGKSAVLDALRFAFSRTTARRVQPSDYDFHMSDPAADPRDSDGIQVEVVWSEQEPDEWPDSVVQELQPVVQTDVLKDLRAIYLRYIYRFSAATKSFGARWEFTNARGEELKGKGLGGPSMLATLLRLFPPFHLSALRDVSDEFGNRSQFWTRLLRALEIPEPERIEIQEQLEEINARILGADPRLKKVTQTLEKMQHVVATATSDAVTVRALPLRIWDLLEKADVVLKARGTATALPLTRHGQGVQSLAVLFLFQAFVENLLEEAGKGTSPLLTLEEPEAHLHPQAARVLWQQVEALPGQKVVTSHSPYFVQNVPFRNLILLRRAGPESTAFYLPSTYSIKVQGNVALAAFVSAHGPKYSYHPDKELLDVGGAVTDPEFKSLLQCFTDKATLTERHAVLRDLRDRSQSFVPDDELEQLEMFARRMRGEILFSRAWLLCEGQSDFDILHAFAKAMGSPLDSHGVSVIDYQNSGSPGAFVALARGLGFPWFMVCDNDSGGNAQVKQVRSRGVADAEMAARVTILPQGDMETYLAERYPAVLGAIATDLGAKLPAVGDSTYSTLLAQYLRGKKTEYAARFAKVAARWDVASVPEPIATILKRCLEATSG